MGTVYSVVIAVILLFPWSVVAVMVGGTLWEQWSRRGMRGRSAPWTQWDLSATKG